MLELLVGLVVLGFILAGLSQGVRFGFRAADTQARLGAARSELDAVDRAVRRLIEAADPGTAQAPASLRGTPGLVTFVSTLPEGAAAYRLADIAVGVEAGRLVLRWAPHRHVEVGGPAPAGGESVLLRGVDHVEWAYFGTAWQAGWDKAVLPGLVRLRVVFPAGDARHWPDIVMAPKRGFSRS